MSFLGLQWGLFDVLATLGIMAILALIWYAVIPLTYWRRRGIPCMFAVPLFGSMSKAVFLVKNLGQVISDMYFDSEGKKYVGYHKFTTPAILLRDPELIKNVLNRDFVHFSTNDIETHDTADILSGRHLFVISGERWKRLRTVLSPGFSSGKMKAVFPLIGDVCSNLRTYLTESIDSSGDAGYSFDLKDMAARYTTDVVASVAFGLRCDSIMDPNTEFRRMGKKFMQPSALNAFLFLILFQLPWLNKILRIPFIPKDVTQFFRDVVLSVVTKREEDGLQRNDYIQVLIQLWKDGKLRVNEQTLAEGDNAPVKKVTVETLKTDLSELDDITAQALGFFADGFETSSMVISYCLFELAHNPEIQKKVRKEVEEKIKEHDGIFSYEAVQSMTYLDMAIQEALRKYPPGLFLARSCTKRYYLPNPVSEGVEGGIWLEEGMPVIVPLYGLQHDPKYYPDPEKFDPERFSPERKRERNHFVYMPFGEGPRVCIGMRFALLQTKLAVATVVSRFHLLPNEKTKIPIEIDPHHFMLASKHGLWVHLKHIEE